MDITFKDLAPVLTAVVTGVFAVIVVWMKLNKSKGDQEAIKGTPAELVKITLEEKWRKLTIVIVWGGSTLLVGTIFVGVLLHRQVEGIRLAREGLTTDRNALTNQQAKLTADRTKLTLDQAKLAADQAKLKEQERLAALSACARLFLEPARQTLAARIRKTSARFRDDANWKTNGSFDVELARRTVLAESGTIREALEQYNDQIETCRQVFKTDADKRACEEASTHAAIVVRDILNPMASPPLSAVDFESMRQQAQDRMSKFLQ